MSEINEEKEGNQEDFIRKIVTEELKAVIQESVKQALRKRKGNDEDEDHFRGPGESVKTFAGDAGQIWSPKRLKKRGTVSSTKKSQLDAKKDCINEEFDNDNDFDEYVLDREYKDGLEDKLGDNIRTKSSEDLLDPLS
ncbi:hypothetical protein NDU88_006329 [Pleurodeles waltl]|uniref:Uncharacterized protein n=1 Tax=Pleurodeles waltl TaxID=8319 RepID=A0AAV7RNI3_PLEWA|nr:hypothetical protein NDU88_006329 [Pleurodeles waltl]